MTPSPSPSECSTDRHNEWKAAPSAWFVRPVAWPEAGLVLWLCPVCHSSVATLLVPALDENECPTLLKEAV